MKKIILMLLVGSIGLSICACGGNVEIDTESTVSKQEEVKTEQDDATKKEDSAELTAIAIGDKITVDFAELTIDECGIKEDIKTSIKTGNFTYTSGPSAESGSKYVYVRGTLKSTAKSEISSVKIGGNVVIDGYTYDVDSSVIEENGASSYDLAPLMMYKYTLYAKVPNQLADSHQSCIFNFAFDENFEWGSKEDITEYKYGYTLNVQ